MNLAGQASSTWSNTDLLTKINWNFVFSLVGVSKLNWKLLTYFTVEPPILDTLKWGHLGQSQAVLNVPGIGWFGYRFCPATSLYTWRLFFALFSYLQFRTQLVLCPPVCVKGCLLSSILLCVAISLHAQSPFHLLVWLPQLPQPHPSLSDGPLPLVLIMGLQSLDTQWLQSQVMDPLLCRPQIILPVQSSMV